MFKLFLGSLKTCFDYLKSLNNIQIGPLDNIRLVYCRRFSLVGNAAMMFTIDQSSGEIETSESLDRELVSEYRLVVMATDSGAVPRSSSVSVTVRVEDVDDNPLSFPRQTYSISLRDPTHKGLYWWTPVEMI